VLHLNDETGKMSKSKGEFLTVSLLEQKGFSPLAYRFFCMQSHYRKTLVFSWENLKNAQIAYDKLIAKIKTLLDTQDAVDDAKKAELLGAFTAAMDNDLNTAQAITVLYDILKADTTAATKLACVAEIDKVLSLNLIENAKALGAEDAAQEIPAEVLALVEQRKEARKAKDFAQADALRDQIAALGWQIRETRQGTEITKI
jgi:cysteinyl-tRNA synthetase